MPSSALVTRKPKRDGFFIDADLAVPEAGREPPLFSVKVRRPGTVLLVNISLPHGLEFWTPKNIAIAENLENILSIMLVPFDNAGATLLQFRELRIVG